MKKLIAILLTLSTLFAASCAEVKTDGDGTTETKKAPDEQTTAGNETTAEEQTTCVGEVPLTTIEDYREYLEFEKSTLPAEVIRYKSFEHIGEFSSFVILSGGQNGDYSQYMYRVIDKSGFPLNITVTDLTKRKPTEHKELTANYDKNDLRKIDVDDTGIILFGNAEYLYVKGELLSISRATGQTRIEITGDSMLSNYPAKTGTFVSSLLDSETAPEAIERLTNME